ncbi:MAG: DUF4271 domain-containing protein [Bacteroidaceae bacterium]|nr:DUF4271 domain-containing protein [Bacteroidaceae bacterium]
MGRLYKKICSTMTGTPIPYFFGNDNLLLALFLLNSLGISYVFILNGGNILQRIKSLFYFSQNSKPYNNQTHINHFCNIILYSQVILFYSVLAFAQLEYNHGVKSTNNTYIFWGVYMLLFTTLIFAKRVIYDIANTILFTTQQKQEWRNSYLFTMQLSGFMLYPLVLSMLIVPHIPHLTYSIYITATALICLLMLISRCKKLIFMQKNGFLHIILYLCALEILPIAVLIKAINELNDFLTINF